MNGVFIDSDVIIGALRNQERAVKLLRALGRQFQLACSALTLLEVCLGVRRGEEERTRQFFEGFDVVALGEREAELAGRIIRENRWKGRTVDFVDAGIAATCLLHGYELLTFNVKHFEPLKVTLAKIEGIS